MKPQRPTLIGSITFVLLAIEIFLVLFVSIRIGSGQINVWEIVLIAGLGMIVLAWVLLPP